jgi:hypothetical protein
MPAGPDKSRKDPQRHEKQHLQKQPPEMSEQDVRLVIFHAIGSTTKGLSGSTRS